MFQVLFLPSNFLSYCISKLLQSSGLSQAWESKPHPQFPQLKLRRAENARQPQPTHPVTTGSFLFLWKSNILGDEKKCTLRNAGTAVSFSHRKLLGEHSAKCLSPGLSAHNELPADLEDGLLWS